MAEDLKVSLTTPERVGVELPLAGIGFRGMAYLIDAGLLLLVGMALYFVYSFFGPTLQDLYAGRPRWAARWGWCSSSLGCGATGRPWRCSGTARRWASACCAFGW